MLGGIWRQLVRWIQQVWRRLKPPQSSEFRIGNSEPNSDNQPNPLSDAGYEQLWMQALDGVAAGWDREQVLAHFGKRTEDRFLKSWLPRFGRRLLDSPVPNKELARRMVLLGGIWAGTTPPGTKRTPGSVGAKHLSDNPLETLSISNPNASPTPTPNSPTPIHPLAQIAAEIGTALLTRELPPLTEAEYESLFRQLLNTTAQGEAAVSAFWQEMTARGTEADWVVWLRGYGKMLLAQAEPNQRVAKALVRLGEMLPESAVSLAEVAAEVGAQMREREVIWEIWEYVEEESSSWLEKSDSEIEEKSNIDLNKYLVNEYLKQAHQYSEMGNAREAAIAWNNRGAALGSLERYEEAVESFECALEFNPDDPTTWNNRGTSLGSLERYEEAVESFERALELKPDLTKAWTNRGNALDELGRYDEAVESFERALELKPDLTEAWTNRGIALKTLGRYEEAVESFKHTLKLNSDCPGTWSNLGTVLDDLGRYDEAVASFERAVQHKSGIHQAWVNRGLALYHLRRNEEAVRSCDCALQLKPDLYQAWINRGLAVSQLQTSILMPSPFAIQNPQLNQSGYLGELATYKEGLKHCPRDTHPEGWGRLHHKIAQAHYAKGQVDLRPQHYFRKARTHYLQALETLIASDFPEWHLEVLQNLIKVYRGLRQIEKAEEFQRRGAALLERLLKNPHRSDFQKQQLALKSAAFNQFTVETLIRQGSFTEALEVAEAGKNACLRWLLYGFEYEPESPDFAQMRDWVQPGMALVSWHLSPVALTAFVLLPGGELVTIPPRLPSEVTISPSPPEGGNLDDDDGDELDSLHRVQQLEEWIARWNREYGEYRGDKDKQENAQKSPVNTNWRGEMDDRLAELAQLLYVGEILDILQSEDAIPPSPPYEGGDWNRKIQRLILIPHRDLHRLPLPALFTLANPDQNLSKNLAITTLPSIKMGLNLSPREIAPTSELLAIAYPNSSGFAPLPYAVLEVAAIRQFFPHGSSLADTEATASRVAQFLETAPPLLHFAGHGTYNFNTPLAAYLALAGEDKLTLKQLLERPLGDIALVTLAACETAITGNETIASEYVGLVSGFLSQGVPYVVSTLWVVESAASALLVAYFYRQLVKGKSPAIALMSAQSWLRRLTAGKLRRLYGVILARLPEDEYRIRPYLETESENLATMNASDRLYESPYHWAAFTLTGLDGNRHSN